MAKSRVGTPAAISTTVSLLAGIGFFAASALAAKPPEASTPAKSSEVQKVLDKYRAVRPGARDLAWFSLDWATTLKEAKERAAKEKRPILFLHTNGRGNLYCGFC